ncbi:MAG: MOSC domain-containing protein [Saprospiraceae bacterium]|nr:MOSC domain-containing protein [Saprospiraceae bacterium]HMW39576.1 MOSC domain-containing protein [Saprospiraceae bacterium]HMX86870.1 MOSC domain-containing protein [Saprospiraceae bacterium]HMZ39022.1 MOSC domain-containing protein [Saprospiraceae bacterium]HNA65068.1 MOSC domain-containing protein [Saprospiraceae bacterium]
MAILDKIYSFPIKSLGPLTHHRAILEKEGIRWDRHWMLVDEEGNFISQRKYPNLNLLKVSELENDFMVMDPENNFVLIPKTLQQGHTEPVRFSVNLWSSTFEAEIWSTHATQWLSEYLDHRVILVARIPDHRIRTSPYHGKPFSVSFVDGYPIHLISQASVEKVSEWCGESIDPIQFRPNFVLRDTEAFEEDHLKAFTIDGQRFEILKPCDRCVMTTIKPNQSSITKEPLSTLSKKRRDGNQVNFGMYAIPLPDSKGNFNAISVNHDVTLEFN